MEQELLFFFFTEVCTLKHSYVPKSSLQLLVFCPVSFLQSLGTEMPGRSLGCTRSQTKKTQAHACRTVRTHISTTYVFHSNNGGNALWSTGFTAFGHGRWEDIPVRSWFENRTNLCQTIINTIWSIEKDYSNKDMIMVQFHSFNQTLEFECILIEEARSQSHVARWS